MPIYSELVASFDQNHGQNWLRQWFVACRHQTITRNTVNWSLMIYFLHSPKGKFTIFSSSKCLWCVFDNYYLMITTALPKGQWVKALHRCGGGREGWFYLSLHKRCYPMQFNGSIRILYSRPQHPWHMCQESNRIKALRSFCLWLLIVEPISITLLCWGPFYKQSINSQFKSCTDICSYGKSILQSGHKFICIRVTVTDMHASNENLSILFYNIVNCNKPIFLDFTKNF